MGIERQEDIRPWHIMRRTGPLQVQHYGELFEYLKPGELLNSPLPRGFERAMHGASEETFLNVFQG